MKNSTAETDEDLEEPVETQSVEKPSKHFVPIYVAVPTVLSTNLAGPNQMLNNIPPLRNVVGPMNIEGYANGMQMRSQGEILKLSRLLHRMQTEGEHHFLIMLRSCFG